MNAQQIANLTVKSIHSKVMDQQRPVLIYTPQNYDENISVNYDVIYVFDSQNREFFDLVHSSISFMNKKENYIVVGIASPAYEEQDYYRNNDYLPEPVNIKREDFYNGYCCNSAAFKEYVFTEVMPYIESSYRITNRKVAIGHSLSASFIIDFMMSHNLFNAYLAICPNFAYDQEQLVTKLTTFDLNQIKSGTFLYITDAGETWPGWKAAREKVYQYLGKTGNLPEHLHVELKEYPEGDHWFSALPGMIGGLISFFSYENTPLVLSAESWPVKIRVKVPDPSNRVFITGNQPALGDWEPSRIEMKVISDTEREINLFLQAPAYIQFTRGDWETKAVVRNVYENKDISIDPSLCTQFEFEITDWFDEID